MTGWTAKYKEEQRQRAKKAYVNNRTAYMVRAKMHKFKNMRNAPAWLTKEQWREMHDLYAKVVDLNREAGFWKFSVDHIEALHAPNACGLHVPWNLRIILMRSNDEKGNR